MIRRLYATDDSIATSILRLALGVVFFAHGAQKMLGWFGGFGFAGTMGFFTGAMHIPAPLAFLAIAAEFFDTGQSRALPWARRPQAAALVAQLADPDRGWNAIVVGEYERAFYGSQYALMAPLFEHYGVQLWMPETGGR